MRVRYLLMILVMGLPLIFNACCQPKIVYVKTPCPKLQKIESEFNSTVWDKNLSVEMNFYDE